MSLNVLLLAHKNAPQVVRFIKSMSHDDVHFFVHLDKKWKLSDSDYESILHANSNVHILKNRVSVFLNHWSAIDATLQLIDLARITNRGGVFCPMLRTRLSA
jgi:phosphatidylinositol kinase/protein kinase (PI-3  family)